MSRFLGRSGEKAFSFLCSRKGVTCNQPQEDDHGWDHVIEFPHAAISSVPSDLRSALPAIFVQTKSHESNGLEVRMKLSNALKLARSPNPCFVVLATLPAGERAPTWHAVHFWSDLLERALRRAREAERDGIDEADFHKHWFSFTMTSNDQHSDEDLLTWLEATVRDAGPDYAAAKRVLHDTIGFDGAPFGGTLQFGPLKSVEEIIDHQLGLTDSLPITNFSMHHRRFGIDVPMALPMPDFAHGTAHIRANPVDTCDVRLLGPDGARMELQGELIFASLPGLELGRAKARIQTPLIDIIWSMSGECSFKLQIDTAQRRSPAELEQICRLLSWGGQGAVNVQVSVRDERLLGADLLMDALPDQPGYARLATLAEPLVRVSRHLKSKVPAISVEEAYSSDWLERLHSFSNGTQMLVSTFVAKDQVVPQVDQTVGFGMAAVGNWLFGALASWPILAQERLEERWSIKCGAPLFLEYYAFENSNEAPLAHLREDYKRHASKPGVLPLDNVLVLLARMDTSSAA